MVNHVKCIFLAFVVWLLGRLGFGLVLFLVGALLYGFWSSRRAWKTNEKRNTEALVTKEELLLQAQVGDLPAWVRQCMMR